MAIAYLNLASATTHTSWNSSTLTHLWAGQTSNNWESTANGANLICTLSDFDNTGVASIDSVQLVIVGLFNQRIGGWTAKTKITDASDNAYYAENLALPAGRSTSTVNGTARTTSDGSTAWTDSNLDGMKISVYSSDCAADGVMEQFYIKVVYTEATGYGHAISGVASTNIASVKGVATADIGKIIGVD